MYVFTTRNDFSITLTSQYKTPNKILPVYTNKKFLKNEYE